MSCWVKYMWQISCKDCHIDKMPYTLRLCQFSLGSYKYKLIYPATPECVHAPNTLCCKFHKYILHKYTLATLESLKSLKPSLTFLTRTAWPLIIAIQKVQSSTTKEFTHTVCPKLHLSCCSDFEKLLLQQPYSINLNPILRNLWTAPNNIF